MASCSASGKRLGWAQDQCVEFLQYEGLVQKAVRGRSMICMCNYFTDQLRDGSHWRS